MKLTLRHAWIHSLMILVMLAATFFSGLHHHEEGDTVSLEQSCEFCFTLKQAVGILPSDVSVLLALLAMSFVFIDLVYGLISLPLFFFACPRGPPMFLAEI